MIEPIIYIMALLGCICIGFTEDFGWIFAFIIFLISILIPQVGATFFAVYLAIFLAGIFIRLIGMVR